MTWAVVVGGKHLRVSILAPQPFEVRGAGHDIVVWIVRVGSEAILGAYVAVGLRHQLHQTHRAGAGSDRLMLGDHGAPTAFHMHHGANPDFRDVEPFGSRSDFSIPTLHQLTKTHPLLLLEN